MGSKTVHCKCLSDVNIQILNILLLQAFTGWALSAELSLCTGSL